MHLLEFQTTLFVVLALSCTLSAATAAPKTGVEELEFGKMPDGTPVKLFTLRNAKGMTAKVMTYGAILTELDVPDRTGATASVVLGAQKLDQYLKA